jgi:periplasmic copper chaperone A
MLSGPAEMEPTMCKSSTPALVIALLAILAGAIGAHVYLLSPENQMHGSASRVVTILPGGPGEASVDPIEIASRAAREVTVAQPAPKRGVITHLFGPRGLPSRLRSLGWHDAAINIEQTTGRDDVTVVVTDGAGIAAEQVWARPTAGAGNTAAAYFTLTNNGAADHLIGASTPIAASAGVHETIDDSGVMKMRPVASLALTPGKPVPFRPGGYHVMLIGLKAPLKAGDNFPLTLSFAHAAPITVTVKVQAAGSGTGNAPMPGMPGMH